MTNLELAKQKLTSDGLAFVIVQTGTILRTGTREGVGELLEAVAELGPATQGAALADKIVGKAVAMIARAAKIQTVYSPLASQAASDALARDHIAFEYDRLVPFILNKRNDGLCPMERLTLPLDDPHQAVAALANFVHKRA